MRYWVGTPGAGRLLDAERAVVSVLDHGFTVADGVFETLKVTDAVPFAPTRHLQRLRRSAAGLGLPDPDPAAVRAAVDETVEANVADLRGLARLRITYTAGPGPLGSERGHSPPTLVVAATPVRPWPATTAVETVAWPRNEHSPLAGLKSTSYADNVLALRRAQAGGASEALMANTRGHLCEGTGSNVFVVVDGRLLTPSLSSGCLPGVTRALVLEWSQAVEDDLDMDVLQSAEEIFITSSTRDVHPVHRVDRRQLPAPGPVTAEVARRFARRSRSDPDP